MGSAHRPHPMVLRRGLERGRHVAWSVAKSAILLRADAAVARDHGRGRAPASSRWPSTPWYELYGDPNGADLHRDEVDGVQRLPVRMRSSPSLGVRAGHVDQLERDPAERELLVAVERLGRRDDFGSARWRCLRAVRYAPDRGAAGRVCARRVIGVVVTVDDVSARWGSARRGDLSSSASQRRRR
jgi:hypothetical protein